MQFMAPEIANMAIKGLTKGPTKHIRDHLLNQNGNSSNNFNVA